MIFAAGLGTRLKPLTDSIPKALVPVGGVPLLSIVVDRLKSAGYDDIVINVHHFADMIEDYVHSRNDFGIKISFSDERDMLLDTGGGVRHARSLLEGSGRFLVHNVDILSDVDFGRFSEAVSPDSLASLLVSQRKTSRYLLFDSGMRMTGWTDVRTGQVRTPYERPDTAARYAFSGIHILSDRIFPLLEDYVGRRERSGEAVPGKFSITDFYIDICRSERVEGIAVPGLHLLDVGKQESLSAAEQFIMDYPVE